MLGRRNVLLIHRLLGVADGADYGISVYRHGARNRHRMINRIWLPSRRRRIDGVWCSCWRRGSPRVGHRRGERRRHRVAALRGELLIHRDRRTARRVLSASAELGGGHARQHADRRGAHHQSNHGAAQTEHIVPQALLTDVFSS